MTVSKREFFDDDYWKEKRYSTLIAQPGKNPADFEFVEMQDMLNYESQQFIDNIVNCGFIGDGFKVFEAGTPSTTKIRIYKGRGWVQAGEPTTGGPEFSGIRMELPDVLTNYPTLTYEHALTGDYYELTITAPNPTGYRYDLVFVKFYRKEYVSADDPEMQDGVLGETMHREKWYYEFVYQEGDGVIKNPDISGLTAGQHGVKLAVIVRHDNEVIVDGPTPTSPDTAIWDMRPKFSFSVNNLLNGEVITVGKNGGQYQNIYDIFPNQISEMPVTLPITPTADNPYIIKLLAGLHTCPYQINIGTTGYIKICGEGVDKTILEFDDLYDLMSDSISWINIGSLAAGATIEFSDMTIRIKNDTYTIDNWLIKISSANPALPGVVKFINCKIGDLGPAANLDMVYGGIYVSNGLVTLLNCDVITRSTTKQAIYSTNYSTVKIEGSRIKQSKFVAISTDTTVNGILELSGSEVHGNDRLLYLNGTNALTDVNVVKEEWNTGDTTTSADAVYILAPTDFASVYMTGPSGKNKLHVSYTANFFDCSHDDVVLCDTDYAMNFLNCLFVVTTAVNVISVAGTCSPNIQNCLFRLGHANAVGVYISTATTAVPIVTHCTFLGVANYMFAGVASSALNAGFIAAPASMLLQNGSNITIENIEVDLPVSS